MTRGHPQGAESAAEIAVVRADRVFHDLQRRADLGHFDAAIRLGERALRLLAEWNHLPAAAQLSARVLTNLASFRHESGDLGRALELLDQALKIDPDQRQSVLATRGMMYLRAGDVPAAYDTLTSAIESSGGPQRGRGLSAALLSRGLLEMARGDFDAAVKDTTAAALSAAANGSPTDEFMARYNLGYILYLRGDLPPALAEMAAATSSHPDAPVGIPALDRARVLQAAGLYREARESIDRAVVDFRAHRSNLDLADALLVGAELALRMGEPGAARTQARQAQAIRRRIGDKSVALVAELTGLRAELLGEHIESGRRQVLVRRAADLASRLQQASLFEDAATARLVQAELALDLGRDDDAESALRAAQAVDARPALAVRLHTRLVIGRIELYREQLRSGLAELRRGLDDLADFQSRFGSQDLQSGSAVHGAELAKVGLRAVLRTGSPAAILAWLERVRAVSTRLTAVNPPADAELADLLSALRVAVSEAREAALAGRRDAVGEQRVADLRRQVRARSWIVAGAGTVQRPLSLAAVQRLLATDPADPTVVAFITGRGAVRALVITARHATFRTLGDWDDDDSGHRRRGADLDVLAAARIPARIASVARASLDRELTKLSKHLIEPMKGRFGGGPLIIAATGELARLPWLLLPGFEGRAISVSASVTSALAGGGRPSRSHLRGVLAVAGPDVPHGTEEVRALGELHPNARTLVADNATGEAVLAQIPAGGLLHVAAHGHHETENPLFSSVQLADGPLFAYDIAPRAALPDQVVLSSCDVGQSSDRPGDEPLGLAAALLRSGVSCVIAGVSKVSDEVTPEVMTEYHRGLLRGDGPAVALAHAVRSIRDGIAPFNCFGSGV